MRRFLLTAAILCLATSSRAADPDTSALPLEVVPAFPNLEFTGWDHEDNGKVNPLRPILLTNAGDGSGRPEGGEAMGIRGVFAWLQGRFGD